MLLLKKDKFMIKCYFNFDWNFTFKNIKIANTCTRNFDLLLNHNDNDRLETSSYIYE